MESQLHHTHGHQQHDDPLRSAGADFHEEDEHGVEKKSAIKKVKAKVHKLKATIKHGHGHNDEDHHNDAEKIMNESPAVRNGLVEPTDMGTSVLAEDLYATHSDILDTPVRSFAQWEEEERHGAPPSLSTGIYGTVPPKVVGHGFNQNVNKEQLRGSIGKSTGMEEHPSAPNPATAVSPVNRQTEVSVPTTKTDPSQVGGQGFDQELNREQLKGGIRKSTGMETTEVSPANHQTEVPAPTVIDSSQVSHHGFDQDVSREEFRGGIGKSTGMMQDPSAVNPTTGMMHDPSAPNPTTAVSPANHQTKVTDPTRTGGKEAGGITDVLRSFQKMGVYEQPHFKSSESDQNEPKVYTGSHDQYSKSSESDQNEPEVYTESHHQYSKSSESDQNEPEVYTGSHHQYSKSSESDQNEPEVYTGSHHQYSKSSESDQNEPEVYTGSHDQFAPEQVDDAPLSPVAGDTEKPTSATSDKAAAAKDLMVSKLGENKSETKSSTGYAHKVSETVTGTLGPVYETVVGVGSSVMSKMQGSERPATTRITEKKEGSVKDYLVEKSRPGDEDKVVSDVITHVFHRNDPPVQEITSTSIYVRDEAGEGRSLQESGN